MCRSTPCSRAVSSTYARIDAPSTIALSPVHGLNAYANVCTSESERTPGKRNRSHVPPIASRASRIAYVRPGCRAWRWHAAPMPDTPAPDDQHVDVVGHGLQPRRGSSAEECLSVGVTFGKVTPEEER